jgi:hypothetical protein
MRLSDGTPSSMRLGSVVRATTDMIEVPQDIRGALMGEMSTSFILAAPPASGNSAHSPALFRSDLRCLRYRVVWSTRPPDQNQGFASLTPGAGAG